MIKGIGIDAVELQRMKIIIETKPKFINKVLTEKEQQQFAKLTGRRQVEYLAGRFCCKEAFSKAWGTGIGQVALKDIEILSAENGAPIVTQSPHQGKVFVTITHTDTMAFAQILLEEE